VAFVSGRASIWSGRLGGASSWSNRCEGALLRLFRAGCR
jgi:hypothetical protein